MWSLVDVVKDVTRIRVMWEKFPGMAISNQAFLRGFIYRAREQRSVACMEKQADVEAARFQAVTVDIREPACRAACSAREARECETVVA